LTNSEVGFIVVRSSADRERYLLTVTKIRD
jgi:hypothetical protein